MNADLIPALLAAGVAPAAAARLAAAISPPAAQAQAQSAKFVRSPGAGMQAVSGSAEAFALYASAAGTLLAETTDSYMFGPGGGALGVSGVSVFDGDIFCSGLIAVANLAVTGDAEIDGLCRADYVRATTRLQCNGALDAKSDGITLSARVEAKSDVSVAGQALFTGPVTLAGFTHVQGQVLWGNNLRRPAEITVLTATDIISNDIEQGIILTPSSVAVLNDFGPQQQRKFYWEFKATTKSLLDLIEFDSETCSLALKAGAVDVVTGGKVTVSLTPPDA